MAGPQPKGVKQTGVSHYQAESYWTPPPPSRREYIREVISYYSGPALLLLLFLALVASGIYLAWPSETEPGELSEAELQQLVAAHQNERRQQAAGALGQTARRTTLTVYSQPSGATVLLDFDSVGVTPLLRYPIDEGVTVLSLRGDGSTAVDTVIITDAGAPSVVDLSLSGEGRSGRGSLPVAARTERRPAETAGAPRSAAGSRESSRATRDRGSDNDSAPRTTRASTSSMPAEGESGRLRITTEPPGALLKVDGRSVGMTPVLLSSISSGTHRVSVHLQGYAPKEVDVEVPPGETVDRSVQLQALEGRLVVLVRPWGSLYINGELHVRESDVEYATTLPVGTHRVTAVHPVLGTHSRDVQVHANQDARLVLDMGSDAD